MMPAKICGMMNIVAYGSIQERERNGRKRTVRILHTNAAENWYAKCQVKLPDGGSVFGNGDIINPTLPTIMEAIKAGRPSDGRVMRRRRRK
jgi:hypothetical protein